MYHFLTEARRALVARTVFKTVERGEKLLWQVRFLCASATLAITQIKSFLLLLFIYHLSKEAAHIDCEPLLLINL